MGKWTKILVGTGVVAAIGGGVAYVLRLNRLADELVVQPTVSLHKVAVNGIFLRVDVRLKNPTRTKLKIKFPFVKLLYKDAVIGSSQATDKDILIPAYGEAEVTGIMIQIPLLGVFSLGGELLTAFQQGTEVKLGVRTLTTVNLGWKKFPYEDTQEFTLKTPTVGS
ncbi:MAG: hypothetical protein ACOZCO_10620 [Bacteroidota bacterium]